MRRSAPEPIGSAASLRPYARRQKSRPPGRPSSQQLRDTQPIPPALQPQGSCQLSRTQPQPTPPQTRYPCRPWGRPASRYRMGTLSGQTFTACRCHARRSRACRLRTNRWPASRMAAAPTASTQSWAAKLTPIRAPTTSAATNASLRGTSSVTALTSPPRGQDNSSSSRPEEEVVAAEDEAEVDSARVTTQRRPPSPNRQQPSPSTRSA